MHLVTGYLGSEHITSDNRAAFNMSMFGSDDYVLDFGKKFAYNILSNSSIRILDGIALIQGRQAQIDINEYEDLVIDVGKQSYIRIDLIVIEYSKSGSTGIETTNLKVIKGLQNNVVPDYINADILEGDLVHQFPLYKVTLDGINIQSVQPMVSYLSNIWNYLDDNMNLVDAMIANKTSEIDSYIDSKTIEIDGIVNGKIADLDSYSQDIIDLSNNKLEKDATAVAATKLVTSRTIALSGDASGSITFDGSENKTIPVVVANDSHTHDTRYYTEAEIDSKLNGKVNTSTVATASVRGGLKVSLSGTTLTISN